MNSFSVCTYNVGSRIDDYFQLCRHLNPSLTLKDSNEEDAFRSKYEITQNQTSNLLINKAEVFCLQEVVDEERPLIKSLKKANFEIIHLAGLKSFDTAIALDKNRFKNITNHSFDVQITSLFKKDVAIATANDVTLGKRITFVSAHAPGFDFTRKVSQKDAKDGDFYCQAILDKLSEINSSEMYVVSADMNASPEKWNPRFQIFTQQGFQLFRKNSATNVNPKDSTDQKREIDFIFTKTQQSLYQKVRSIFFSTTKCETVIKNENSIDWNANNNSSDHIPVFVEISPIIIVPKVRQLWNAFYYLLSNVGYVSTL